MFISRKHLSRRTLLKGVGASVAVPFLNAMIPAASAQSAERVHRFGFVYVPNGMNMQEFMPSRVGPDYDISRTLEPLADFRDYVNVITGLFLHGHTDHPPTPALWLSGTEPGPGDSLVLAKTVDQHIADKIGSETTFRSMQLATEDQSNLIGACGTNNPACGYMNSLCWASPTQQLPMEINPRVVFEQMFGDDSSTPEIRAARMRTNTSILDAVTEDVRALNRTIGVGDRGRIEEYLDAVREVERQIVLGEEQRRENNIVTPNTPVGVPSDHSLHVGLMFELQALALQADMTRVTTFMLARELSGIPYPEVGVPDAHHAISHHGYQPEQLDKKARIDGHIMGLFASYLERLHSTPDVDGSLLDNITILYGGGISDSQVHDHQNLPAMVVGGGAGTHKSGRHIKEGVEVAPEDRPKPTIPYFSELRPFSNLLLTLMNLAGTETDSWGIDENASTGRVDV